MPQYKHVWALAVVANGQESPTPPSPQPPFVLMGTAYLHYRLYIAEPSTLHICICVQEVFIDL